MLNVSSEHSFNMDSENFKLELFIYSYNTRSARNGLLLVPSYNSVRYGRELIIHSTTLSWNDLEDKLTEYDCLCLSTKSFKKLLLKFFVSAYDN